MEKEKTLLNISERTNQESVFPVAPLRDRTINQLIQPVHHTEIDKTSFKPGPFNSEKF